MEINFREASIEQLLNPDTTIWDWKYCSGCSNQTPHTFRVHDKVCQSCNQVIL